MQRNRIVTMKAGKLGQTTEDRQRESKELQQRKVSHKHFFKKIKFICYMLYIMCSSIQVLVL